MRLWVNGKQIYNEASLQYELAKFLEKKGYSVKLEFNIKDFMSEKNQNFVKKDVDIVAFKEKKICNWIKISKKRSISGTNV